MSKVLRARRGFLLGGFLTTNRTTQNRNTRDADRRSRKARLEQLESRLALAGDLFEQLDSGPGKPTGSRPGSSLPSAVIDAEEVVAARPSNVQRSIVPGEIIIAFSGDADLSDLQATLANNLALSRVDLGGSVALSHLLTTTPTADHAQETLVSLHLGQFADVAAVGQVIEQSIAGVAWTQPNFSYTGKIKEFDPNDPLYAQYQYHHVLTQTNLAWGTTGTNLGSPNLIVAVTDDGLQLDHPDLMPNLYVNPDEIAGNGVDDDTNGFIDDVNGWDFVTGDNNVTPVAAADDHGTHVAGTIAARTNNAIGVAGTAGGSKVMPLRFAGADGGFTSAIVLSSFRYAADNGARIVNTSYDIDAFVGDAVFTSGLQYVYDNNLIHVNSAGNNDILNPTRQIFHQTLLVGQTNEEDLRSGFSNYGTGIDISAPGDRIVSTFPGGLYGYNVGTSMSAAIVSGAAALIWSANPALTRDQVVARLLGMTDNIDAQNPAFLGLLGSGRVNPNLAINGTLAPPKISRLREVPTTANPAVLPLNSLNVGLASVLDKATVETAANWSLVGAGPDDAFETGDDITVTLTRSNPYMVGANEVKFTFPTLATGSYRFTAVSGGLRDPFSTALDGDANGTAGGDFVQDFRVTPGTVLFSADFSDATGAPSSEAFTVFGATSQWKLTTGRGNDPGHSADDSAYFGNGETAAGGGFYNNLAVGSLTSPIIDLTGYAGSIRLELNHYLKSEEFFDFASVGVIEGGGIRRIAEAGTDFAHDTNGFEALTLDLSAYAGRAIRVRFTFAANASITEEGWYIDDVVVRAQTALPVVNLSGQVWNDINGNRVREGGDNALAGWTVYLDSNNNGTLDSPVTNIASTNVPVNTLDRNTVTSAITVSGLAGFITDIDVSLNLTHTYVEDLDLTLRSPTGFLITLASALGGSSDNYTNTRFDDEAPTSITTAAPPFTGSFRPQGTVLAAYDGTDPNGTWVLEISDFDYDDVGTLLNWSLHITTAEPSRVTSATGDYAFNNLTPGTQVIREVLQATWNQSVPIAGFYSVNTIGGQSLTTLDFANSQGAVLPATFVVTAATPTPTGVVLDFNGDLDASALNLYDTEGGGIGPIDLTLVSTTVVGAFPIRGSAIVDPGLRRLTFIATNGRLPADTYSLTLRSAMDGFKDSTGALLDGDSNGTAGGNFTTTFAVTPPAANAVAVSLPNFSRGPQQPVNLPALSTTGIPISFSDGGGILTANFTLQYDPALLIITGATVAPGLTGANVNINTSTPGTAIVQFVSPTPLAAGTTRFVDLQANVPNTALYRTKHLLNLANIALNGGTIPAIDDDAVHVVAYFGDVTANGGYTSLDASRVSRLAVGLDSGLLLYKLLDPVIIADLSESGSLTALDTSRVLQASVGLPVDSIPSLPNVPITQGGPDPKLSIPTTLTATPGSALTIPVQIDSIVDLTGAGLESADLILYYDPAVITVNSVSLGSLLASAGDWFIAARIDAAAGRILISAASPRPIEGFFAGDLVELHATVQANAPAGASAINLAASSHSPARYTMLNEGYLTLIPAPTDAANDPGVDGLLTVIATPSQPAVIAATAQLIANQLMITGTSGNDRIFVAPIGADLVRVRIGSQLIGDFTAPTSILIDGRSGSDFVYVGAELPPTLIATTTEAEADSDAIFGGSNARWIDVAPASEGHDQALLQLMAQWSNEFTPAAIQRPARPWRLMRG